MQVACDTFCLDMDETLSEASQVLHSEKLSASTVRFVNIEEEDLHSGAFFFQYLNLKKKKCLFVLNRVTFFFYFIYLVKYIYKCINEYFHSK